MTKPTYAAAKTIFFLEQITKAYEVFKLHVAWGVWGPDWILGDSKSEKGEWNNVTEHCLMVMTRGEILAEMLNLPEDLKKKLCVALALHDISKPEEVAYARKAGETSWDGYEQVVGAADEKLKKLGFDEDTLKLSGAMGHPSLLETMKVLENKKLSDFALAFLIAHYSDDISLRSDWCEPTEIVDGKKINQFDRRMGRNVNNPNIKQLGKDGKSRFGGRNTFEVQEEVGHAVETRLANELSKKGFEIDDPLELPCLIDDRIKDKIRLLQEQIR